MSKDIAKTILRQETGQDAEKGSSIATYPVQKMKEVSWWVHDGQVDVPAACVINDAKPIVGSHNARKEECEARKASIPFLEKWG
jgi:hypothetical protein